MEPLREGDPLSLGGYRLLGRIGSGGMGEVFLGQSPAGQLAAVKIIKASVLDEDARNRFVVEADSLRTVYGAGVAAFLGADPTADRPWLAVEYVHGPDLRAHVSRRGPLNVVETASLGALLAEAMATVHEAGLLHRDLKPQNILLAEYGPKIIDFGLAVLAERLGGLTAAGIVVGSIMCMSPEQARGETDLTPAVDVYALGAVLLYAATGHYPYDGPTWQNIALRIEDPATPPDLTGVPLPLRDPIAAMLAADPTARPGLDEVTRAMVAVITTAGSTASRAKHLLAERSADERAAIAVPQADGADRPTADGPGADGLPTGDTDGPPLALDAVAPYTPEILDPAADSTGGGPPESETLPVSVADALDQAAAFDTGGAGPPRHTAAASTPRDASRSGTRRDVPLRIAERMRAAYARDAAF